MSGGNLRVEALVSGRLTASSRMRVLQHVGPLRDLGIEVTADPPRINKYSALPAQIARNQLVAPAARMALKGAKVAVRLPAVARSWRADVTWLERELLPGVPTLEPYLGRPVLFDVDDAIWLLSAGHERAAREIGGLSACVIAGNDFLADWFEARGSTVERVWTAVDTAIFRPRPDGRRSERPQQDAGAREKFVIGWTGSGSTLRYLDAVAPAIARFLDSCADARLVVMADFPPTLSAIDPGRVEFVKWDPSTEGEVVSSFDVGLMPLPDSDWGRGKCAAKMLQYMACGVPCIVSPVGMSSQILAMKEVGIAANTDDEWVDALRAMREDRSQAASLGEAGRLLAESHFSVEVISRQLAQVMTRHG